MAVGWKGLILEGVNEARFRGLAMNTNNKLAQIDMVRYAKNRRQISSEALAPYAGQWVAISGDGTCVLTSGHDLETAEANLAALGIPGNAVGWERIPGPDENTWL